MHMLYVTTPISRDFDHSTHLSTLYMYMIDKYATGRELGRVCKVMTWDRGDCLRVIGGYRRRLLTGGGLGIDAGVCGMGGWADVSIKSCTMPG